MTTKPVLAKIIPRKTTQSKYRRRLEIIEVKVLSGTCFCQSKSSQNLSMLTITERGRRYDRKCKLGKTISK